MDYKAEAMPIQGGTFPLAKKIIRADKADLLCIVSQCSNIDVMENDNLR